MKKLSKILSCIAASVLSFVMTGVTAFADEYSFDMEKTKQTQGGGQAYVSFTRLDNERRDRLKFNPLWITSESTFEIDYTSEGEYDGQPMNLIFQSWVGALVDSTEDKWVQIPPTTYDETHAVWTYDTLTSVYGDDFSDVYAIVVEDSGTNSLLVTNITVTNLSVPADERENVAGGILTVTTVDEPVADIIETEAVGETDAKNADDKADSGKVTENAKGETSSEKSSSSSEKTTTAKVNDDSGETTVLNVPIWGVAVAGVAVVLIIVIVALVASRKRKNRGWH